MKHNANEQDTDFLKTRVKLYISKGTNREGISVNLSPPGVRKGEGNRHSGTGSLEGWMPGVPRNPEKMHTEPLVPRSCSSICLAGLRQTELRPYMDFPYLSSSPLSPEISAAHS